MNDQQTSNSLLSRLRVSFTEPLQPADAWKAMHDAANEIERLQSEVQELRMQHIADFGQEQDRGREINSLIDSLVSMAGDYAHRMGAVETERLNTARAALRAAYSRHEPESELDDAIECNNMKDITIADLRSLLTEARDMLNEAGGISAGPQEALIARIDAVTASPPPPPDGPTNDYRDQLYALLLRRGLHTQDEAAEIAFGEGPQPKCDGQSCVHCEPENGCSRPPPPVGHPVPKVDWEVATEALREIAGYVGEDEKFDLTARDMRECARDALKVIDENERTRSGIDPPCFAEKNDGVFYVCRCPKCRATATKGGE
jgi:hypothetical protein